MRLNSLIRSCVFHLGRMLSQFGSLPKRHLDSRGRGFIAPRIVLALGLAALAFCGGLLALRQSRPKAARVESSSQLAKRATGPYSPAQVVPTPVSGQTVPSGPLQISLAPLPARQVQTHGQPLVPSLVQPPFSKVDTATQAGATALVKYGNIPMSFEANKGQADANVRYQAHGSGYKLSLEASGATLSLAVPKRNGQNGASKPAETAKGPVGTRLPEQTQYSDLKLNFVGANATPSAEGLGQLPGKDNYFLTSDPKTWFTNIPTYSHIQYKDLYPGVDLVYYGNQRQLEYDFVVAPGSDPKAIALQLLGSREQHVAQDGGLVVAIDGGEVRFQKPIAYQKNDRGERVYVDTEYALVAAGRSPTTPPQVHFQIASSYDPSRELIIDPVLSYSTFGFGFSGIIDEIAVDSTGNAYLASSNGASTAAVTKLSPDGTTILYSTVLGTSGVSAIPEAIAIDSAGNVYLAGIAYSNTYPTTPSAFQTTFSSGYHVFATRINPTGSSLLYSTFLAGSSTDYGYGLAVDSAGKMYLTGQTYSTDFPTTTGAFQTTFMSNSSAVFVSKIDPTLSGAASLVYSTFVNGTTTSVGNSIAVDSSGQAYVTGNMDGGFPKTTGAFSSDGEGATSGGVYVTKLNAQGSQLAYSAFLGVGTGVGIAVDGSGNAYVTGSPTYTDFPTTSGAYQTNDPGGFVTKLNPAGSSLVYSTFLSGPSLNSTPQSIAITPNCTSNCSAYVAGYTNALDFPVVNPIQNFSAGGRDDFVVQLSGDGSSAVLSTYLGGSSTDGFISSSQYDPSIAVDGSGNVYIAGGTESSDFPVTLSPAFSSTFIAKISPASSAFALAIPSSVNFSAEGIGITSAAQTLTLRNLGSAAMTISSLAVTGDFSETDNCVGSVPGGGTCTISAKFAPTLAGTRYGTITVTGSGTNSPTMVNLQGIGQDGGTANYSPTALSFGSVAVGTASAPQTTTLTNIGNKPLTISQFLLSQNTPPSYSQTNTCPDVLAAGANCTISVTFTPTQPGYLSGTLYDNDNGNSYGQTEVTLTGSGTVNSDAALTLSATSLNFSPTVVGTTSAAQIVYATSTGSTPISISSVSSSITDFTISSACSITSNYPPGNYCYVYVYFVPTAAGLSRTGTLTFTDNTSASPHQVSLSGTGVAKSSTALVTPSNLVFGSQLVGTESSFQYVSVYNTGIAPLTIDRVEDTSEFPTQNNCSTVSPGTYCTIYFYFLPAAAGSRTATISIISSASNSPQTVSVSGTGFTAASSVLPTTTNLVFDPQLLNTTSAYQPVYVYNTGNVPLTFTSVAATPPFAIYSNGCTGNLPADMNGSNPYCPVYIDFTPTTPGAAAGTATITTSAGTQTINLSGTGLAPSGTLSPTSTTMTFDPQVAGSTSAYQPLYVYNIGDSSVTFGSVVPTGDFAVYSNGCTGALAGNLNGSYTYCTIYVNFTPTAAGARTGTLTINSSDPSGPQIINLNGTGVATTTGLVPTLSSFVFGPQVVNTTSTQQLIYLYNQGDADVTSLNLAPSSGFAISPNECPTTLAGSLVGSENGTDNSNYCYFYVTFTPTTPGMTTGTITITSSDGTQTINLSGAGVATTTGLVPTVGALTFGPQIDNTTSANQLIYLYNDGDSAVTSLNLMASSGFAIASNACSTSLPGSVVGSQNGADNSNYCYFYVNFTPTSTGLATGTITITSSDGTQTINLSGTGVAATRTLLFIPAATDFGSVVTSTTTGQQQVIVYNSGTETVTFSATPTVSSQWTISSNGCGGNGSTLTAGSSCSMYLTFTPASTGPQSGTLTFSSNATNTPQTVTVTGTGVSAAPGVTFSPATAAFGPQAIGTTSASQSITAKYNGTGTVTGISVTPSANFSLTSSSCGASVTAPATCTYNVAFAPTTTAGNITGTLTVTDSQTGSPFSAQLDGFAFTPVGTLTASTNALAFLNQPQGSTGGYPNDQHGVVTITNTGNVPVTGVGAAIGGTNSSDFAFYSNGCGTGSSTLSPGQSCIDYLNFTPGSPGARTGTLTINSTNGGTLTINLTGTGVASAATLTASSNSLAFLNQPQGTVDGYPYNQHGVVTITNTGNVPVTGIGGHWRDRPQRFRLL